jgi:hypothetical protein
MSVSEAIAFAVLMGSTLGFLVWVVWLILRK